MTFRRKSRLAFSLVLASSFLLALGAATAEGAKEQWKAVAGKDGVERVLYDPDSVIPSGPRRYRVWIMGFDKDHFPRKSLEEFDCANRIVRDVEVIVERPNKPVAHTVTPSDWTGVVRESPRGELFKILCR
jgi:hypothetical protein